MSLPLTPEEENYLRSLWVNKRVEKKNLRHKKRKKHRKRVAKRRVYRPIIHYRYPLVRVEERGEWLRRLSLEGDEGL